MHRVLELGPLVVGQGGVAGDPRGGDRACRLAHRHEADTEGDRDRRAEDEAARLQAGDRVLFGKWSGTEVTLDGEELLIMKESDILGIIG